MAATEHLELIKKGTAAWNQWRGAHKGIRPELSHGDFRAHDLTQINLVGAQLNEAKLRDARATKANLRKANLSEADLRGADLSKAILRYAYMNAAQLQRVNLRGADLTKANLSNAKLDNADLSGADLTGANLTKCKLRGADLTSANLMRSQICDVDLSGAILSDCRVYGASVWNVRMDESTLQCRLVVTPPHESALTVDNLEVAQFIYLILANAKLRSVIDTVTSKIVLILGRFTPERKVVLDVIRSELGRRDYVPVVFDFELPAHRDTDETVNLLARMARFVVADLTEAKSIPQELKGIVPSLPSVPVQPIVLASSSEYGMFDHMKRFPWVLETFRYADVDELTRSIDEAIICPAEAKVSELRRSRS